MITELKNIEGKNIRTIFSDAKNASLIFVTSKGEIYRLWQQSEQVPTSKRFLKRKRSRTEERKFSYKHWRNFEFEISSPENLGKLIKDTISKIDSDLKSITIQGDTAGEVILNFIGNTPLQFKFVDYLIGHGKVFHLNTGYNCPTCAAEIEYQQEYCMYCKSMLGWV